jgi:TRAP-type C4-dicarboxylate transport system permease small subunit
MTSAPHGESNARADRVAAWATGVGIGLLVFMVTWILGDRVLTRLLSPPEGPVAAMAFAILLGTTVTVRQGRRLARRAVG